jgi:hypothetical protein
MGNQYAALIATPGKPLYGVAGIFDSSPLGLVESPLWHTRYHNFAPRIGAAWRLSPNTVLRGRFGLFYDLGYGEGTPVGWGFPYVRINYADEVPALSFNLNSPAFQPLPFNTTISPTTSLRVVDDFVPGQPFWIPDVNQPGGRILNPKAFAIPSGNDGNFPRNSLRGFPFNQADIALRRRFNLHERLRLEHAPSSSMSLTTRCSSPPLIYGDTAMSGRYQVLAWGSHCRP